MVVLAPVLRMLVYPQAHAPLARRTIHSCVPGPRLMLLGTPTVTVDGVETALPANAPASLLAYLALARDWVPRTELAYLYRPDEDEAQALRYLRLQLHRAQLMPWASGLRVEPQRVRFDADHDVATFDAALAAGDVAAAVACYRGPLLAGYALRGRPTFDTWLELERATFETRYRGALERLAEGCAARGEHEAAVAALERLSELDDLDEDAFGALLRALVLAGRVSEARRRFTAFEAHLRREVGAEPAPGTRAALEDAVAGAPVRAAQGAARPALPEPATRFVGRSRELAELDALLDRGDARLVTLLGLGGAGKTRLALEFARRRAARHADGAVFVSLSAVTDADLLFERIAEALGLEVEAGAAGDEFLTEALEERDVLLVLDEFEPLVEHAARLAAWLAGDGAARVLVTSRRRLALRGEVVLDLAGLRTDTPAEGGRSDAVTLLLAAARRVEPRLQVDAGALDAAERIVRAVEGLPLALELAATWVRAMPLDAVAAELEAGFHLLETDLVDVPERHRSMRAVLDRTWNDLSPAKREALARLSVLSGGGTLAAAEAVSGAPRALLLSLLNQSLLQRLGPDRFGSHALVAQFAAEALAADPLLEAAALDAHAEHYAGRLAEVDAGPEVGASEALLALAPDLANLERAWLRLLEEGACARALDVAKPLFDYYDLFGHYRRGGELCRVSLERLDPAAGIDAQALVATVEVAAATTARERGELGEARAFAEAAAGRAREARRGALAGRAERCLGDVLQLQGEFERAEAVYERAAAAFEAVGDEAELANVLNSLGSMEAMQERFDAAEARFVRCVSLFERVGDELSRATALNNLGYIADARGDAEEAARRYERSLEVYERLAYPRGVSSVKNNLLVLYGTLGRLDEAEAMGRESLAIKEAVGDTLGQIVTLKNLGDLQVRRGAPERADAYYLPALRIAHDAEALPRTLQVLVSYAAALDATGRQELASAAIDAVLRHPVAPPSVLERARSLRPDADRAPAPDPERLAPLVARLLLAG
jgi:DNA-binding SARP family transcriptional activator